MKSGFSNCFDKKDKAIRFFSELNIKMLDAKKDKKLPSTVINCIGKSPFGESIPFPYAVNTQWALKDEKHERKWDSWICEKKQKMTSSDEVYWGPPRVEEFNESFDIMGCVKIDME